MHGMFRATAQSVMVGGEDHLFQRGFADSKVDDPSAAAGLAAAAARAFARRFAGRGSKLLLVVVPDKHLAEAALLPHDDAAGYRDVHERLIAACSARGVTTVDALPLLTGFRFEGESAFLRTDWHWNDFGAQRTAEAVAAAAGALKPLRQRSYSVRQTPPEPEAGDLLRMAGIDPRRYLERPWLRELYALGGTIPKRSRLIVTDPTGRRYVPTDSAAAIDDVRMALAGTSFSASDMGFGGLIAYAIDGPVRVRAWCGLGAYEPLRRLAAMDDSAGNPPTIAWEAPSYALLKPDTAAVGPAEAIAGTPPVAAAPLRSHDGSSLIHFQASTSDSTIVLIRNGRLFHDGVGSVMIRVKGATAPSMAGVLDPPFRTSLGPLGEGTSYIPVLSPSPTNGGGWFTNSLENAAARIELTTDLDFDRGPRADVGAVVAGGEGFVQTATFPSETPPPPEGAQLQIQLALQGRSPPSPTVDARLEVYDDSGSAPLIRHCRSAAVDALILIDTAALRGRITRVELHGSGPAPQRALATVAVRPLLNAASGPVGPR